VEDPKSGETKRVSFDYQSEGAHVMGCAAAPNGTICGGTAFPMRFFSYDPKKDDWVRREAYGQWNTVAPLGDRFFVGAYSGGHLLEWEPARPWVTTREGDEKSNPRYLVGVEPVVNRPHDLLAQPDGKWVIMAGTPGYGLTGGGLLFWDRQARRATVLEHTQIIPDHSTMSLAPLPGGKLLGGTTIAPGTGGRTKAKQAELYIMDLETQRLEWHQVVFPDATTYTDLLAGPDGLVFGFANGQRFFVFDAAKRQVIHQEETAATFGRTSGGQGPRVFVTAPDGRIFILFSRGIASLNPKTFQITMLAESPVPINVGGDYLDGRIYFASGSHIYSYQVP
ncbi:MAG: hypothetical protein QHJ73_15175, partial [Armatimonadota bacterium]|nr:hypothetical protein [Armatimonadota bacterium]